ncbi:hypothetical protein CEUSTIGMA_g6497.t1 [Chlamydomonas eustigma]|uniref:Sugar phosphate phosphatase n=1 Tax=Chlamydomonas eustigma TaxID=1157962 RepID=A0A250X7L5_9CHLO|nr:hypothetical protein CEUSTIGMA_g6497.t1 [Chlamydomonas eustigma]|eukprot:GAX79057.1 hypothetical protein CEUSTIGMA_g6497.t1 [Chlamydomonas eustigma]
MISALARSKVQLSLKDSKGLQTFGRRSKQPYMSPVSANALRALDTEVVCWPLHSPLAGREEGSFAQGTITTRLPSIVSSMTKDLKATADAVFREDYEAQRQVLAAVTEIEGMKQELLTAITSCPLNLEAPPGSTVALQASVSCTNECMDAWRLRVAIGLHGLPHGSTPTWLNLPWLLVECYMYVRIAVAIQSQPILRELNFDPFKTQKLVAFDKSSASITNMAQAVHNLVTTSGSTSTVDVIRKGLYEVIQYSLWGNKTDLSLLVDASKIDPSAMATALSSVAGSPFLIVDEFDSVSALLCGPGNTRKGLKQGATRRIDIVLDNSGLELYSDLCLADVLIHYGLADEAVFHGKPFGWFVSDTTREDFSETIEMCAAAPQGNIPPGWTSVQSLATRWKDHLKSGRWRYTEHVFWVTPAPTSWMHEIAPDLYQELSNSNLIIFKGDLNYRKLVFDCRWPAEETSFKESLMGFSPASLLSLRTLKADVIAGLKSGQCDRLHAIDGQWQVNGKFAVIQSHINL